MRLLSMQEAIGAVLDEEMERDNSIIYFGEDVQTGGTFGAAKGLLEKYGIERVFDTPIAEATICGAALGMALMGLRPVVELGFADFFSVAFDEIYNKLGKWNWMHGGIFDLPVTIRLPVGIAGGAGPEHSQSPQALFLHSQGLYVVVPSSPYDARGLLKTAIRDPNPVLFFEHKLLYHMKEEIPGDDYTIPLGKARVKREGEDITVIGIALQVHTCLNAAKILQEEGISLEVIDPRTLIPLDKETILHSVKKTGKLIIVHEEPKRGGAGAELAAIMAEEALFDLDAPIVRIGGPDVPIAQNIHLEPYYRPSEERIMVKARELMEY